MPLLFLNAALYMLVRYLNVLLRLENDLRALRRKRSGCRAATTCFICCRAFSPPRSFVLAVAAILSFGVVAIAFGYKYRSAVLAPLPTAQLGGIARQAVPYGIALAPAQILFSLSSGICLSFVGNACGESAQGLFAFGYSLAQLVTAIQAGFSTYWGPYVYAHYRAEQERICRVHDVLDLLIFGFFLRAGHAGGHRLCHLPRQAGMSGDLPAADAGRCLQHFCARARSTATRLPASRGMTRSASGWGRCPTSGFVRCWCRALG